MRLLYSCMLLVVCHVAKLIQHQVSRVPRFRLHSVSTLSISPEELLWTLQRLNSCLTVKYRSGRIQQINANSTAIITAIQGYQDLTNLL